ncbi:alkylation response protein AidB-like acyl-CoA dehydrogenase [Neobacillus niacini]|nr:alkylation response protein AidB-like acyl-CoA dehydrogenase [Neobacillus niacini]
MFNFTDEQKMIQTTVRNFVQKELIPIENEVLKNEREGKPGLSKEKLKRTSIKGKRNGFLGY